MYIHSKVYRILLFVFGKLENEIYLKINKRKWHC